MALIHSEGINAGEMKHGPLALVDENLPIVVVSDSFPQAFKISNCAAALLAGTPRQTPPCPN